MHCPRHSCYARADDLLVCARVCLRLSPRAACVNICDVTQPAAYITAASSRRATASHRPCISSHSHLRGHSLLQPFTHFPSRVLAPGTAALSLLGDTTLKEINPIFCMPEEVIRRAVRDPRLSNINPVA